MATKIRLQRHGDKKRPFYHIVAANSSSPRDGKFLEKLGTYNPMLKDDDTKRVVVNAERAVYWLSCGAQPTERVAKFFSKLNIAAAKAA